ncbi:DUF2956 domain-containing protein [Shewanella sp. Isolate11]|uniref:DUF2956 domain-containing protein n=1 Tax=Shewanella sp. Isolate11 TaxID=2908530 RepID=UPI001EFD9F9F|nr:DUF2956 domain-containing protein [Shewanella sp. Isolate11]MCG9695765.1 DUF2956 domain-containing protein [Shewanella sp. Isolate11]
MNKNISSETKNEALKVAKATQKPGQTKEQTKLIALGIEKGIAEYKKQQKSKARQKDKARKQELKAKQRSETESPIETEHKDQPSSAKLPWILLLLSWIGFAGYLLLA